METTQEPASRGNVRKREAVIIWSVVGGVLFVAAVGWMLMPSEPDKITDAELEVWDAVLADQWQEDCIVVDPLTVPVENDCFAGTVNPVATVEGFLPAKDSDGATKLAAHLLLAGGSGTVREALDNLLWKSREAWPVENGVSPRENVHMLSPEDRRELFVWKRGGWEEFRSRFTDEDHVSAYRIQLSRVGLSKNGRLALVFWREQYSQEGSSAHLDLYVLEDSGWKRFWMLDSWLGDEQGKSISPFR